MPVYVLILWLLLGAAVGFLAPQLFGNAGPFGRMGDIVAGVVGGYGLGLVGASGGIGITVSLITSGVVAFVAVWALRKMIQK